MPILFEYGKWVEVGDRRKSLQRYLHQVWLQNKPQDEEVVIVEDDKVDSAELAQGFLQFDGDKARAQNFIGFVQVDDFYLEIYPKIFKNVALTPAHTGLFIKHIFFWFDYCRKWRFPFTNVNLENTSCENLPELIINLMASQMLTTVASTPLMLYVEVEESLMIPRGRINFNRYINNGLVNANQHVLECDHEPLMFDNQLNRVIKYVSRQLLHKAKFTETREKLDQILFILDEVSDEGYISSSVLDRIKVNSFFDEYQSIIDICKLVLREETYSNQFEEQRHWSLLFPMEYIFEDFVAGFLEAEFSTHWKVEYQKSNLYLTDKPQQAFQMQHDIYLTLREDPNVRIIIDTKYKLRPDNDPNDNKRGIAQSDMYQMVSYGLRRGCNHILLLYPNYAETCQESHTFTVSSGFDNQHKMYITAAEIPFWSMNNFSGLKTILSDSLKAILKNCK